MHGYRKPMNWISPIGLRPCAAMPTHKPLISSSASGVSSTRSDPKRCCSPAVARNTPPLTPTSSPSTTTLSSSSMARASARLTASTRVSSGIGAWLQRSALARISGRQFRIKVVEHGLRLARDGREITLHRSLHALLALGDELLLLRLGPRLAADQIRAQSRDRLLLPARLNFLGGPIACGVVGRGMVAEPIGDGLDQTWPAARLGSRDRLLGGGPHGNHVVAVHLLALKPGGDRLLGQGRGRGLQLERHADGPLIVVGDEDERQLPNAGEIHRLPDVALRSGAVVEEAHRDAGLLAEPERIGDAGGMRRL